ncbi:non-hydrolyzing UDP-N-acetylglucosamine 2-epimerase [Aliarcobacter butzleri]|uniref:non-hydrolyzing UDP-N-acetylglucosamine 2-epimerase n=1 Tax=Aliarcobacter butzleri TaxID=28197 RepID=UPI001EDB2DDE|nr:UDP-N-acetylglucosamine 2-epimerase (non-hydrolyzing) [Aliarcobacter butzleri]MCG3677401.1 UDP-N-acetylglucosamine 2-epimerase (non-hydrolyzing) [Aliarcobacter butzleri]
MKILTILGARPQFIKAGSVSREIAKYKEIEEIIVHTGQHYDANMSDIFFDEMQIPKPNYFLGIGGKSHGAMTGQMIEKIEEVSLKEKPDWIMVYGDTNSTLAGAIVASKLHIKLAHIEAGLRSFNMKMPEEVNRILTDRVSNILFCPTDTAIENLKNEGYEKLDCKIVKSGDVMQDGAMFYRNLAIKPNIEIKKDFILCTIHRAENTDDEYRLRSIFEALEEIAKDKQVILPLHPRTKKILENLKLDINNLNIIEPVGYLEMVWLIDNCDFVMTDSGGLQKEAYFFEKQCITLRDETEWVELVECKVNTLVGANKEKILEAYKNNIEFNKENPKLDLYGGGKASENIIKELIKY